MLVEGIELFLAWLFRKHCEIKKLFKPLNHNAEKHPGGGPEKPSVCGGYPGYEKGSSKRGSLFLCQMKIIEQNKSKSWK